jgi:hypothetical protein
MTLPQIEKWGDRIIIISITVIILCSRYLKIWLGLKMQVVIEQLLPTKASPSSLDTATLEDSSAKPTSTIGYLLWTEVHLRRLLHIASRNDEM